MGGLNVWSLNGGRFVGKRSDEESPTLKWLKGLSEPSAEVPDVLCLQDFRASLLQHLGPLPHFHFAPMTNHLIWGKRELAGIVIASKWPLTDIRVGYTWGDGIIKDLQGVGDDNLRIKPDDIADSLILETEGRVVIAATVLQPGGVRWRVATHHGFWVRGGVPADEQMESANKLGEFLLEDADREDGLIFAADCNFDRKGQMLQKLLAIGGLDCLPSYVHTTLPTSHPGAKFGAKPDRIMVFPDAGGRYRHSVQHVRLDDSPKSDHLMLRATVFKNM